MKIQIEENIDFELRDYQVKLKKEIYNAWETQQNIMLQMPTGTGKTRLFSSIVKDLHNIGIHQKKAIKILILVHRRELIEQIAETIGYKYNIAHGVIMSKVLQQKRMPVQIASIQTLIRQLNHWTEKKFDVIIIDEAHHSVSESYIKVCETFPDAKILGVTATPYRLNGQSFKKIYEKLIVSQSINDFITQGYLSDYKYFSIKPNSPIHQSIKNINEFDINGDYSESAMFSVMDSKFVKANILNAYKKYAIGKKGIVYTINKKHNKDVCNIFLGAGVNAKYIDSDTSYEERNEIVRTFKLGKIDILCNVNIFSEGFDCPDIEFIQIARPTKSLSLFLQQVGRGLRPHPDIDKVIFIDNVGSYNNFGLPSIRRDWEKYFIGAGITIDNPSCDTISDKVEFIDEVTEGEEEVDLLYSGLTHDIEFDEVISYEMILKTNGYTKFPNSIFFAFCGFEFNDLKAFTEDFDFYYPDIDDNADVSITYSDLKIPREYKYYTEDFIEINDLFKVRKGKLWGIYKFNKSKSSYFDILFDSIEPPNGLGFAIAEKDSKKGLLDIKRGTVAIPFLYDNIESLFYAERFNFYLVENSYKYGILDENNNIIIPVEYDEIDLKSDIINIRVNNHWYIYEENKLKENGFEIIKKLGSYFKVKYQDYFGLWDQGNEKIVLPFVYKAIEYKFNTYKISYTSNYFSHFETLLDEKLDFLLPFKYNMIEILNGQFCKVEIDKYGDTHGFGLINIEGKTILKPEYLDISLHIDGILAKTVYEWRLYDFDGKHIRSEKKKKSLVGKRQIDFKPKANIINKPISVKFQNDPKPKAEMNPFRLMDDDINQCDAQFEIFLRLLKSFSKENNLNLLETIYIENRKTEFGFEFILKFLKENENLPLSANKTVLSLNIHLVSFNNDWHITDSNKKLIFFNKQKYGKHKLLHIFEEIVKTRLLKKRKRIQNT